MPVDFASTLHSDSLGVLDEPGGVETVLINADALSLLIDVNANAEKMGLDAASFTRLAVRRFMERADDEDWASLTSSANAQDDPLGTVVVRILRKAVADAKEVFR